MSPRWIGSIRYTNLLMKMRSWSFRDGIMLVPSTFTGWYKNTMTNAEIASEMTRSRIHDDKRFERRPPLGAGCSGAISGKGWGVGWGASGTISFPILLDWMLSRVDE